MSHCLTQPPTNCTQQSDEFHIFLVQSASQPLYLTFIPGVSFWRPTYRLQPRFIVITDFRTPDVSGFRRSILSGYGQYGSIDLRHRSCQSGDRPQKLNFLRASRTLHRKDLIWTDRITLDSRSLLSRSISCRLWGARERERNRDQTGSLPSEAFGLALFIFKFCPIVSRTIERFLGRHRRFLFLLLVL